MQSPKLDGRRVLVTGAGGFIGSHLTEALLDDGCSVRAMVRYNSVGSNGWLDTLPKDARHRVEVVCGDIRDSAFVRAATKGCDVVFHLAALIGIPYSYAAPESYVDTNVKGTLNVLQACRDTACSRVLITSTSEVYGTAQHVPITEGHPRQPQSPYSATKISADALAESFHLAFGLPVTTVRPFNTYGPRQSARAVIPTIITQALAGATEIRLGSLHPTRDLVFVKDTARGFIALAASPLAIGRDVNIATQQEISIGDLANKILQALRSPARVTQDDVRVRPTTSEVERLLGSCARLREITGWAPSCSLDDGLAQTIDWFSKPAHQRLYKPDVYGV